MVVIEIVCISVTTKLQSCETAFIIVFIGFYGEGLDAAFSSGFHSAIGSQASTAMDIEHNTGEFSRSFLYRMYAYTCFVITETVKQRISTSNIGST